MADIDVRTEGIRTAFAYNEAVKIDLGPVQQFLTPATQCLAQKLPGCVAFRQADQRATDTATRVLTRADQLVKGLRNGAAEMANRYDKTDAEIADTLKSISVSMRESNLPPVDDHLDMARRLNEPFTGQPR